MDSRARSVAKAISWQLLGLATTTGVAWIATGSLSASFATAAGAASVSLVCYILHERVWEGVRWGRQNASSDGATPQSRKSHR